MMVLDPVWVEYAVLGVLAGILTTVAGLGGGLFLLLALASLGDPAGALAVTAPALLLGNLHRLWRGREHLDQGLARPLMAGALPGSLVGGALAVAVPSWVLSAAMVITSSLALARSVGLRIPIPAKAAVPMGFFTGVVTATSGGAALIVSPFLRARGLSGPRFVATSAATAIALHAGRLVAYGAGGLATPHTLGVGLGLALAIGVGNRLGEKLARQMGERVQVRVQDVVTVVCVGLALLGVAR